MSSQFHKEINGVLHKRCKICEEWLPCTSEYFYKNKTNKTDGLHPYCKKCARIKAKKYRDEHIDIYRQRTYEHYKNNKEIYDSRRTKWMKENKDRVKIYYKKFQKNNAEYFSQYNKERMMHKKHEITKEEWESCLRYFDYSCAYCGIPEKEHKQIYNKRLHKEHVDHDGANDLSNAVPACTTCNSSKWAHPFEEWYKQQEFYDEKRYKKIIKWLNEDYKLFIEQKST